MTAMDEEYEYSAGRARIPEDTLLYAIFPDFALSDSIPAEEAESRLKELQVQCLDTISDFAKDYIWQHESFNLQPAITSSCLCTLNSSFQDSNPWPPVPHLHGRLKYGDNLEDEWFVVFILHEITKCIPSVSARVWDTDGEFLLIEAAYAIPRWLRPENSWNRVFIWRGELHILPLSTSAAEVYNLPVNPSVRDSLRALTSGFVETRASDAVQNAINGRIKGYPDKARVNMHRVRVRVLLSVAQVLKHEPHLISKAVEAFYDRDVDSMKAASRMERFLGNKEMVDVSARMSRAMYAQLVQQAFQAPRCYPIPPLSSPNYKDAELGMKISCGFEMMYQQRLHYQSETENAEPGLSGSGAAGIESSALKAARSRDIGWEAFRRSLVNRGYFKGLLEGSKEHKKLMDEALDYYRNTTLFSRVSKVMHAPVECIDEILALPHSSSDFVGLDLPPNDDDTWLYNGEEDLNAAMLERQKEIDSYQRERLKRKQSKNPTGKYSTSTEDMNDFNPEDVAKNMQAFVDKMSSYEGAEVSGNGNSESISMDMRQFIKELKLATGHDIKNKGVCFEEESLEDSDHSSLDMDFDEMDSDNSWPDASKETYEGADMTKGAEGPSNTFMDAYSDALKDELKKTSLTKSFVRAEDPSSAGDKNKAQSDVKGTEDEDLKPVDIDVNLVQSLLDSFSSQQGLPGPASNLLGLMGFQLPDDSKRREHDL